jgi:hypothetical protein
MTSQKNIFLSYYLPGILIILLGLFLLFRSLIFKLPAFSWWASNFDTPLIYWIANWGFHVVFEAGDPGGFFQANSFYPQMNTLAYSDSLLGLQFLFAPLRLLGLDALSALYLSLALTILIAGIISIVLLRRIEDFTPLEISVILFGSFFCLSATGYLIHYQLFGFYLIVPFILSLFIFIRDLHFKYLVLLCSLAVTGIMYAIYLAPVLLTYTTFLAPLFMLAQWQKQGKKYLKKLFQIKNFLAVLFFAGLVYFIQLKPYFFVSQHTLPVSAEMAMLFSATPLSLFQVSQYSYWYPASSSVPGAWESAYFPGYILLILFLGFIGQRVWRIISQKKNRVNPHPAAINQQSHKDLFSAYILVFFIISILFSLGPYLKKDLTTGYSIPMPYYFASKILPGLNLMRSPGRFGMMIGLPLSLLGIRFLQSIHIGQNTKKWIITLVLLGMVVEAIPNFQTFPFNPDPHRTYQWLARQISPGSSLLELPLSNQGEQEAEIASKQLVGSTLHWARLVSGYGAHESPEYRAIANTDREVQVGDQDPIDIFTLTGQYKIEYILIHLEQYSPKVRKKWTDLTSNCSPLRDPTGNAVLIRVDSCQ